MKVVGLAAGPSAGGAEREHAAANAAMTTVIGTNQDRSMAARAYNSELCGTNRLARAWATGPRRRVRHASRWRGGIAVSSRSSRATSQDLWDAVSHDTEQRNWTYLAYGPVLRQSTITPHGSTSAASTERSVVLRRLDPARHGRGLVPADRARSRLDRGGSHQLFAAPAADAGVHRGDVSDDEAGVRAGVSALRMEVRRAQRTVTNGSSAARLVL